MSNDVSRARTNAVRESSMKVTSIRTCKVTPGSLSVEELLEQYLDSLEDCSILAIASKIVALCEGRCVPVHERSKDELVREEAELYLPAESNRYGVALAIKHGMLTPNAGIDESNADGNYVLWPKDTQKTANDIRQYLMQRFGGTKYGVILTDSAPSPLRWGVTGVCVAHSGFEAVRSHIGEEDLFGRKLQFTKVNVANGLASAANLIMGEASEQTPLAVITDVPFIEFQDRAPNDLELQEQKIEIEDDLYGALLSAVPWQRGTGT